MGVSHVDGQPCDKPVQLAGAEDRQCDGMELDIGRQTGSQGRSGQARHMDFIAQGGLLVRQIDAVTLRPADPG
jgi:hypothetical protein